MRELFESSLDAIEKGKTISAINELENTSISLIYYEDLTRKGQSKWVKIINVM